MPHTVAKIKKIPPQHQNSQPGSEKKMIPRPVYDNDETGFGRLNGKVAIITGGDSGIGRAVAVSFAKEGADIVIVYLNEHADAKETESYLKKYGNKCLLIATDISEAKNCKKIINAVKKRFGS
ncbi:MAG: SDR family NAD(P)-dependent oxidoreductase, partial [Bacteroidota bacterium]